MPMPIHRVGEFSWRSRSETTHSNANLQTIDNQYVDLHDRTHELISLLKLLKTINLPMIVNLLYVFTCQVSEFGKWVETLLSSAVLKLSYGGDQG